MKLYSFWRSSTSYRTRIALGLKGLHADNIPVNIVTAEHRGSVYAKINPEMRMPTLIDGEHTLTQSLAIIEYLEEKYPEPPLLPLNIYERARVRALALAVACDISPLNNTSPLLYLSQKLGLTEEQKVEWMRHWISSGFEVLEQLLITSPYTGTFCHGATPGMADCCLVPQLYNARRYHIDLTDFPLITRIDAACAKLPAFIAAHPSNQPDAVK